MNFKQLQALIYVARHGTFKQAAEALYFESPAEEYVTPESMQYRIKQLEHDLKVSLYRKRQGSSRVLLTREGQLFLREAIEVYKRMRDWREMFLEASGGKLSFASTQAVIIHRLHDAVMAYRAKFPNVRISISTGAAGDVETLVSEGTIDFGISIRRPEIPELEYVTWKRSSLVVIAPVGHPLCAKKEVTLLDIAEHPLVLLDPDVRGDRDSLEEAFARSGIRQLNIVLELSNSEIIASYVEAGAGISVVSEAATLRQPRKLVALPIRGLTAKSEAGLLVREGQYLPARVRNFLTLLDPFFVGWLAARDEKLGQSGEEEVAESKDARKKK